MIDNSLFNWTHPEYRPVFEQRLQRLQRIRKNPEVLPGLRAYYRDHTAEFINDWGQTLDPRNVDRNIPAVVPFLLFPRQVEWIDWTIDNWRNRRYGLTVKSRDMGLSWLSVGLSCTLCLFHQNMIVGMGSRKEEYVDKLGDPKSLFEKVRMFMAGIPPEFKQGWERRKHAPFMNIRFPGTGSSISGEVGDNIGRGNRTGIYLVDETAFLERPLLIDSALSQTTNCRQDISTPNGLANPFAERRFKPGTNVFEFNWRQDPRKDQAWYDKQVRDFDPTVVAQEINLDFSGSVEGVLIPSAWVQAAIDSHAKLGITPTGKRMGSLDVADEGRDKNAFCGVHGTLVEVLDDWTGQGGDIFQTVQRAFALCDEHEYLDFRYDADGLGVGVRGDARILNEARGNHPILAYPFKGSNSVYRPRGQDMKGRYNEDAFQNLKAQAWWSLRMRFQAAHRAVVEGMEVDPDTLISISGTLPNLGRLTMELSQPTFSYNQAGRMVIDKAPLGSRSPNLADTLMIAFAPMNMPMVIQSSAITSVASDARTDAIKRQGLVRGMRINPNAFRT